METSDIVYVSVILAAIILWNLVIAWQIRSHTNSLVREIRTLGASLGDVEREQEQTL